MIPKSFVCFETETLMCWSPVISIMFTSLKNIITMLSRVSSGLTPFNDWRIGSQYAKNSSLPYGLITRKTLRSLLSYSFKEKMSSSYTTSDNISSPILKEVIASGSNSTLSRITSLPPLRVSLKSNVYNTCSLIP